MLTVKLIYFGLSFLPFQKGKNWTKVFTNAYAQSRGMTPHPPKNAHFQKYTCILKKIELMIENFGTAWNVSVDTDFPKDSFRLYLTESLRTSQISGIMEKYSPLCKNIHPCGHQVAGVCSKEPMLHPDSGLGPLSFAGCTSDDSDKWKSQAGRQQLLT